MAISREARKGWKLLAWFSGIILIVLALVHWRFGILDFAFHSRAKTAAFRDLQTAQKRYETGLYQNYHKGYVEHAQAYQAKVQNATLVAVTDSNGAPILASTTLDSQFVFREAEQLVNGQPFVIVTLSDSVGVKIPNKYYAILGENFQPLTPKDEEQIVNQQQAPTVQTAALVTPIYPSQMPDSFIHHCTDPPKRLGWVNPGDILHLTPKLLSDYILWDPSTKVRDRMVGLGGTGRTAKTCNRPFEFLAPNLPCGALIVYIPGRGWQLLDKSRKFYISAEGEVCVAINDRKGFFWDNQGKVSLDIKLVSTNI